MSCVVGQLDSPVFQTWSMGLKSRNLVQLGSLYDILTDERLNHRVEVETGILEDECSYYAGFFRNRRKNNFCFKMNRNVI